MQNRMGVELEYNREEFLRYRFNSFLVERFDLPSQDYYSSLTAEGFIGLKSALSDINNILTLKVTLSFADWLADHYVLDKAARSELHRMVLEAKPNSNGYDVWLGYPVTFVGEVKCNIPINNGSVYGSAQRHGIEKDVVGLLKGKRKASINPESCPKYLAFLDIPQIRAANEHLLSVSSFCRDHLVFVEGEQELTRTDIVYGVYVSANV
ncbi:hypothetical protein MN202_05125 [Rheinheimera muenzenbergensis]|uniref:Uncharacterized protein n=1 Tax=Rheinheimera muenzenbergensis TaxID=1193628 RepID=A0ABU8C3W5_9GAMM